MKICLLTHSLPRFPGDPSAPFIGELAYGLTTLGHEVLVVAPFDKELRRDKNLPYQIITYKYAPFNSWHVLGYSRTFKGDKNLNLANYLLAPFLLIYLISALYGISKVIKKEKIEIITSHWLIPSGFMAAIIRKITRIPYTVTIPGSDVYLGSKNILFKTIIGIAAKNASIVISDSQHYLKQLEDLGFNPRRTSIIRYGVDSSKFKITTKDKVLLKKYKLTNQDKVILVVGRLVEKKGFIYLIKAMPEVLKKIPQTKLLIVGEGDQRQELTEEMVKLGIENKVIFARTVSFTVLAKYYNLADVFVMPSIKDSKGNIDASPVAMMEAMSCGVPIVATKFSGSEDFVTPAKTSLLVKEKDVELIAKAVLSILMQKDLTKTRKQIRKIAQENFSIKSVASHYTNVFKQILA